jgi:uncharacterized protein (DUF4213/DUF364 family)
MTVRGRIREIVEKTAGSRRIEDVRVGLTYTAVGLDNGGAGVAYTFKDERFRGCSVFSGIRPLTGKLVAELSALVESNHKIESALGLAIANAVMNVTPQKGLSGDVLEVIEFHPTDKVAMIGAFGPLIPILKRKVQRLDVFEEKPDLSAGAAPAAEALRKLSDYDVALISSTTIINNTVEGLLEAASRCRETVLLGPSTPLVPEIFRDTPITCLSGMTVEDRTGIFRVVSEGGGTRLFQPYVKKWNVAVGRVS